MVNIEYKAHQLAEYLPGNYETQIIQSLDELSAIELQFEELSVQINPDLYLQPAR